MVEAMVSDSPTRAPRGRVVVTRSPWVMLTLVAGLVLAAVSIVWWDAHAPRTTSDSISSVIVMDGLPSWAGALVMPLMLSAAGVAAAFAALVALPSGWSRGAAAAAALVAGVAALVLVGSAIDSVAGALITLGAEHIAAVPLVPHALGTWALIVTAATTLAVVVAVRAPAAELRTERHVIGLAFRGSARLAIVLGFALVARLLWREADGSRGAAGFAVLTLLGGLWLAVWSWVLSRGASAFKEGARATD